jgi:ribosome biogenesis protein BMS1
VQIVKKLKLIGTPIKIFRKTAFLHGMFSSNLEATKFIGAKIKTVSGIRGQIKKPLTTSSQPNGSVRASFEDKILMSDVIFLRSWFAVDVPKFYTPIANLLASLFDADNKWTGLKRLGELKRDNSIAVMPNENSLYKKVVREERVFAPLKVREKIEQQLPFRFKSKDAAKTLDAVAKQRVAIIRQPHEEKVASVVKMFKQVFESRMKKKQELHAKHIQKHKKDVEKIDLKRLQKSKVLKKQVYRRLGKQERRKNNSSRDE